MLVPEGLVILHRTVQLYDYTAEVRNRFKGHLFGVLFLEGVVGLHRTVQLYDYTVEVRRESRPSPRKRNAKKQNGCLRRPYK